MAFTEPPVEDVNPPEPLTKAELATLRAEASQGIFPTMDTLRRVIFTIRKSWAAKPVEKTQGKSRVSKPKPDEAQIDFF